MSDAHKSNASTELIEIDRARLDKMEADIRSIKESNDFAIYAIADKDDAVRKIFGKREGSASLYLLLEKHSLTQAELSEQLGINQSNVSRICNHLLDAHFIQVSNPDERIHKYIWANLGRRLEAPDIARQLIKK